MHRIRHFERALKTGKEQNKDVTERQSRSHKSPSPQVTQIPRLPPKGITFEEATKQSDLSDQNYSKFM